MKSRLDHNAHDRRIWEEELEGFVPRRIFDAHAHLFWHTHLPPEHPGLKAWHDADHARYPRIKWILAHCARSFTYWPIRESVERLRDLPNIFYDLSAVCDVRPILTLFQKEDVKRIFFGSDGVSPTFFRSGYFALVRSWVTIAGAAYSEERFPHCDGRPILAIYENLLAIKQAAEIAGFGRREIEAIFWKNAARQILGNGY